MNAIEAQSGVPDSETGPTYHLIASIVAATVAFFVMNAMEKGSKVTIDEKSPLLHIEAGNKTITCLPGAKVSELLVLTRESEYNFFQRDAWQALPDFVRKRDISTRETVTIEDCSPKSLTSGLESMGYSHIANNIQ